MRARKAKLINADDYSDAILIARHFRGPAASRAISIRLWANAGGAGKVVADMTAASNFCAATKKTDRD